MTIVTLKAESEHKALSEYQGFVLVGGVGLEGTAMGMLFESGVRDEAFFPATVVRLCVLRATCSSPSKTWHLGVEDSSSDSPCSSLDLPCFCLHLVLSSGLPQDPSLP